MAVNRGTFLLISLFSSRPQIKLTGTRKKHLAAWWKILLSVITSYKIDTTCSNSNGVDWNTTEVSLVMSNLAFHLACAASFKVLWSFCDHFLSHVQLLTGSLLCCWAITYTGSLFLQHQVGILTNNVSDSLWLFYWCISYHRYTYRYNILWFDNILVYFIDFHWDWARHGQRQKLGTYHYHYSATTESSQ